MNNIETIDIVKILIIIWIIGIIGILIVNSNTNEIIICKNNKIMIDYHNKEVLYTTKLNTIYTCNEEKI